MKNFIIRFSFRNIFEIEQIESWLSDMAQKGYFLKKYGKFFITFQKEEPQTLSYRIAVLENPPTSEQIQAYQAKKLNFVTNYQKFYIFQTDDNSTAEFYTTWQEYGYSLQPLEEQLKSSIFCSILLFIFIFLILVFGCLFDSEPVLFLLEMRFQFFIIMIQSCILIHSIYNYSIISKHKKSLLQGNPMNHHIKYQKSSIIYRIFFSFLLLLYLSSIAIPFIEIKKEDYYTLPVEDINLPIVRLKEIEQSEAIRRETEVEEDEIDSFNRVSYEWSLLVPTHYEIHEKGIILNNQQENTMEPYSPSIYTDYYELTFQPIAKKLTMDLIHRYSNTNAVIKEITNTAIDKIYFTEDDTEKQIFAYYKNKVIYVSYQGNKNLSDLLPLVLDKLLYYDKI